MELKPEILKEASTSPSRSANKNDDSLSEYHSVSTRSSNVTPDPDLPPKDLIQNTSEPDE